MRTFPPPRPRWAGPLLAALLLSGTPAWGAWTFDQDENRIDDRIEAVAREGVAAAYEDRDPSKRMTIAVFAGEASGPSAGIAYGVYIGFARRPTDADLAALADRGVETLKRYEAIDYVRGRAGFGAISAVAALPGVTRVEAIPMMYAANHFGTRIVRARDSRGLRRPENYVLFPSARAELGLDGDGVVIAILDTGVNDLPDAVNPNYPGHESLAGKFLGGGEFYFGDPLLNTPNDQSMNPSDHGGDSYHATHVAGSALGTGGQDGFFAGVAPAARMVDCKVLSDAGVGFGAADGIDWCIANQDNDWGLAVEDADYAGIDVLNLSLGCIGCSSDGTSAQEQIVNAAMEAGLIVCIATGNDDAQSQIASPAGADLCISVGASTHGSTLDRGDDRVADFSNEGPRLDDGDADHLDEMKPSVVAPGANIQSASGDFTSDGGAYHSLSGTSMATPHVAGVCALLRQANPGLTPLQIRSILQNTAEHFIPTSKAIQPPNDPFGVDPNYNPACGWGLVDAYAAAKEALNAASGVQVVKIRALARPGDGEIDVTWVTQREYPFQGFNVRRAPDAGGAPGSFTQVNTVLVAPAGDATLEADDNRTPYTFVDGDPALALGQTYWYQVEWVDAGGAAHAEPAAPVTYGQPPFVATAYYRIAHNAPDTDLTVTLGSSASYDPHAAEFLNLGSNIPADQDSVIEVVPTTAASATVGSFEHWWSQGFAEDDGAGAVLPPSLARPWFLNVAEGHFINRSGRITSYSLFVNDSPGSEGGTLYVTNSTLPAATVEGQETAVWIPEQTGATSVESASFRAEAEGAGVRLVAEVPRGMEGGRAVVRRGGSAALAASTAITDSPVGGAVFVHRDQDVREGQTYWYWIEFRSADGRAVMAGPVACRAAGGETGLTRVAFTGAMPWRAGAAGSFQYTVGADIAPGGSASVALTVHDVQGRVVATLARGTAASGTHHVEWDARDDQGHPLASGMYFYRFQAGRMTRTDKLLLAR